MLITTRPCEEELYKNPVLFPLQCGGRRQSAIWHLHEGQDSCMEHRLAGLLAVQVRSAVHCAGSKNAELDRFIAERVINNHCSVAVGISDDMDLGHTVY